MSIVRLTDRWISACRPPRDGRLSVADGLCKGLHLRVTTQGTKTFSVMLHEGGRLRRRTLGQQAAPADLEGETEARWRLVETAWELGVADTLIEYDAEAEQLIARPRNRRVAVTSSRAALNGYQKGHCFYCFAPISISAGPLAADVDHVFPWSLRHLLNGNVNGVWNLVLACRDCNRGSSGKHDCVPALNLVERLHRRNEFLITSRHPLRETLVAQTGAGAAARVAFLQRNHTAALTGRIIQWHASSRAAATF